jgi:hypothetical protein
LYSCVAFCAIAGNGEEFRAELAGSGHDRPVGVALLFGFLDTILQFTYASRSWDIGRSLWKVGGRLSHTVVTGRVTLRIDSDAVPSRHPALHEGAIVEAIQRGELRQERGIRIAVHAAFDVRELPLIDQAQAPFSRDEFGFRLRLQLRRRPLCS